MTQTELNKQIIRRFIDEVVNTGNVALLAEFVAPDCVETDGKVRIVSGVTGMAEHINAVRGSYPDLFLTIECQVAAGEWGATPITARGTHSRAMVFQGKQVLGRKKRPMEAGNKIANNKKRSQLLQ